MTSNGAMTLLQAAQSLETWNRRRNNHQPQRQHYTSSGPEIMGNDMKRGQWASDHPSHEQQGRSRHPLSYPSASQSQYPLEWEARKTRQNSGERRMRPGMKRTRDVNLYTTYSNSVMGVGSSSYDSHYRFSPKRIARPASVSSQTRQLNGSSFPPDTSGGAIWDTKKGGYHRRSSKLASSLTSRQDRSLRARILKSDDENSWSSENGGGGPSSGDSGGGGTSGNSRGTRASGQTVGKSNKGRARDLLHIERDPSEMSRTSGSSASTWSTLSNEAKVDFNFQTLASMGIKEVSSSCMKDNMNKVCISDIQKRFTCHACTKEVPLAMILKHHCKYPCDGRLAVGPCDQVHSYSFCRGVICSKDVGPLRHCSSCKRCMPLHSKHCNKCNKCYVFGSTSLKKIPRCPCEGLLEENLVIDEGCHVA